MQLLHNYFLFPVVVTKVVLFHQETGTDFSVLDLSVKRGETWINKAGHHSLTK